MSSDDYERINVVDEGVDNTGSESIVEDLEALLDDNVRLYFPSGKYYMDEQIRFTDFENLWLEGVPGETTIVPASADSFSGEARLFKLGTYYEPGDYLQIEGFTFDFTASNTGSRAIQAQVNECCFYDIDFVGEHDSGTWGPMEVDIIDPEGSGIIEQVRMPDGGRYTRNTSTDGEPTVSTGPTGMLMSPYHRGELRIRNCEVGPFPDNGLYVSGNEGRVIVEGGEFYNSNIANIRMAGNGSAIRNATIVVDENRSPDENQPGIRLDDGNAMSVKNVEIVLDAPNGDAIRSTDAVSSATIEGCSISIASGSVNNGIVLSEGTGEIAVVDTDIEMDSGGQAIQVRDGSQPVVLDGVTVTGDASGAEGGREAIRVDRSGTELTNVTVDQPGDDYRRAVTVTADDCTLAGGTYESTYYPITNEANGTTIRDLTARSYDGYEAVHLIGGYSDVTIVDNTLYGGIRDDGTSNLREEGNETPE
ncbi:right-handed parallel beta-helix repeat-containing protein [Halegenticoccus tardaugens]|uniref:right-handed parallel beta-helix repeat-containing protein n=1 Tax=Halegenticoccus tardaugens TaxID=2071624 RepID=UPI00100A5A4F|nr:right-handed parallel beta-helix repeat-containing protein [Halegenticoccus tardaugens]